MTTLVCGELVYRIKVRSIKHRNRVMQYHYYYCSNICSNILGISYICICCYTCNHRWKGYQGHHFDVFVKVKTTPCMCIRCCKGIYNIMYILVYF